MKKLLLSLVLILFLPSLANAQVQLGPGVPEFIFSANNTAAPQTGTVYAIPTTVNQLTWVISYATAPGSVSVQLECSNDNVTFVTCDTSTNVAGEARNIFSTVKFIRATESARTGGSAITITISGKIGIGTVYPAAYSRLTAQTAAIAAVVSIPVGNTDNSFLVNTNVLVTTSTTHSFNVNVVYTDEGNTARTIPLLFVQPSSTSNFTIANAQGAVPASSVPLHIRAKSGTTVTLTTSGTFTTVTYNIEGYIRQIS